MKPDRNGAWFQLKDSEKEREKKIVITYKFEDRKLFKQGQELEKGGPKEVTINLERESCLRF